MLMARSRTPMGMHCMMRRCTLTITDGRSAAEIRQAQLHM